MYTTLRPGLLVRLSTSIKGNVRYSVTELEGDHLTDAGERKARWETERTVRDPDEHQRATKARSKARSVIAGVCARGSSVCLMSLDGDVQVTVPAGGAVASAPVVSPDGRSVAVLTYAPGGRELRGIVHQHIAASACEAAECIFYFFEGDRF